MSAVLEADLHDAIYAMWDANGGEQNFTSFWSDDDKADFVALNDGQAADEQPFPYLVFVQSASSVEERMSGDVGEASKKRKTVDVPIEFRIHAQDTNDKTAKEVAEDLAEIILQIFGGHPDVAPKALTLTGGGSHLITQKTASFGIRTGDNEHQWTIRYNLRLDLPFAV